MASLDRLITEISSPPLPLERLDLSNSTISTRALKRILNIHGQSLTSLNLEHNAFERDFIFDVSLSDKLTELNLSENIVNCTELNALSFLTNIVTLKLNNLSYMQSDIAFTVSLRNIILRLPHLRTLEVRRNILPINMSIVFYRELANINSLTNLDLSEGGICLEEIAELSEVKSLRKLNLSHNQMSSDVLDLLGDSFKDHPNLESLILSNTLDRYEPITKLAQLKKLTELDLSYNTLVDHQLEEILPITDETNLAKIVKLKLTNNYISNRGALTISSWLLSNQTLKDLDLSCNLLTYQSAEAIAKALKSNTTLQSLGLSTNGLLKTGIGIISKALSKKCALTKLNVSNNQIEHVGLRELILKLKESKITELDISHNDCETRLAILLADQLEFENIDLKILNIANGKIKMPGAQSLIKADKLTELDISDNHVSSFDLNKLCLAIKDESSLTKLALRGCFASINTLRPLHNLLSTKNNLSSLDLSNNRLLTAPLFINSLLQQNDHLTEVKFNEPQSARSYTSLYLTMNKQLKLKNEYNKYSENFILQAILILNISHQTRDHNNNLFEIPKFLLLQILTYIKPKYRSDKSIKLCFDRIDKNLTNRKDGVLPWWESILIQGKKLNKIFERST